jgi:hypothetical protein
MMILFRSVSFFKDKVKSRTTTRGMLLMMMTHSSACDLIIMLSLYAVINVSIMTIALWLYRTKDEINHYRLLRMQTDISHAWVIEVAVHVGIEWLWRLFIYCRLFSDYLRIGRLLIRYRSQYYSLYSCTYWRIVSVNSLLTVIITASSRLSWMQQRNVLNPS